MIILYALIALYSLLLIYFGFIWARSAVKTRAKSSSTREQVSVVIAFRNEKDSLDKLIASLSKISYPKDSLEFIFVNDHSTDESPQLLMELLHDFHYPVQVLNLPDFKTGKKNAQLLGIENATYGLIMTTDSDCEVPSSWIEEGQWPFSQKDIHLVTANLTFRGTGFWNDLMRTELASLLGITGVSIFLGNPILANGANMAFRKASFQKVLKDRNDIDSIPSGDDTFLLEAIKKEFGKASVSFSQNNVIKTDPPKSFQAFFYQRIRWAAKWKDNISLSSMLYAIFIWLFHLAYASSLVYEIINAHILSVGLLIGIKMLGELVFIGLVFKSYTYKLNFFAFLFSTIFYSFYVIFFGFTANFMKYKWKERPYG